MLGSHNKFNQILLLYVNGKNLTYFVNANHSVCCCVPDRNKNELIRDSLSINQRGRLSLIHKEVAVFTDYEDYTIFWRRLNQNWEISKVFWWKYDLCLNFKLLLTRCGISYFHDVKPIYCFCSLLFTESKQIVCKGRQRVRNREISKATSESL